MFKNKLIFLINFITIISLNGMSRKRSIYKHKKRKVARETLVVNTKIKLQKTLNKEINFEFSPNILYVNLASITIKNINQLKILEKAFKQNNSIIKVTIPENMLNSKNKKEIEILCNIKKYVRNNFSNTIKSLNLDINDFINWLTPISFDF